MSDFGDENFNEVIEDNMHYILEQVHTCLPGQIVTYDGTFASVQPVMLKQFRNKTVLPYPIITGVPVQFPRTLRSGLSFDLLPGDLGLIVFAERNIDNWALSGLPSVPADSGKFNLSDAFFLPGVFPKTVPDTQYKPLTTTLYRNDAGILGIKNAVESMGKLIFDWLTADIQISTAGSPGSHVLTPTSIAAFTAIQVRAGNLFGVL